MKKLHILLIAFLMSSPVFAVEFTVTREDDPAPDSCQPSDCSLREAINAANALTGNHTVNVPAGSYLVTRGVIVIDTSSGMFINGAGEYVTHIDAAQNSRIFSLSNTTVQMSNIHLLNGYTVSSGGAILSFNSNLAVVESILSNNSADVSGGAIHAQDTSDFGRGMILIRTRFENNTAGFRAAAVKCGAYQYCTIEESAFINNTSTDDEVGSVLETVNSTQIKINRSLFTGNTASRTVARLASFEQSSLLNNTLTGNTLLNADGSAVAFTAPAQYTVENNTITANGAADDNRAINASSDVSAVLKANIIDGSCVDSGGVLNSEGYNYSSSNNCGLDQVTDVINTTEVNLNLLPLTQNIGYTETHALGVGSVARNKQTQNCQGMDQQGVNRNNPSCDVGAYQTPSFCSLADAPIPGNSPNDETIDIITIDNPFNITDLDVYLDISHTYLGDLTVTLTHVQSKISVQLFAGIVSAEGFVCNGDDLKATFDQNASLRPINRTCMFYSESNAGDSTFPGNWAKFTPDSGDGETLDIFNDTNLSGDWELKVIDGFIPADNGTLNRWCVLPTIEFIDAVFENGFD